MAGLFLQKMVQLLQSYWKPLATLAVALSVFAYVGVLKQQRNAAVSALQAYKISAQAAADAQQVKTARIEQKQAQITTKTAIAYNDTLLRLKAHYEQAPAVFLPAYTNGLRLDASTGGSYLSQVPDAAGQSHADPESHRPGSSGVTALDCAQDVLTLLTLQQWVTAQTGANNAHD